MGGRKSKRSLRIALFFVRAISKLLIAWEAGSCLKGTHPKATKAEFVITVRPCWTYAIYSTHFFMLAEIWNSIEQATRSLKMPRTEILNNKTSICWKPYLMAKATTCIIVIASNVPLTLAPATSSSSESDTTAVLLSICKSCKIHRYSDDPNAMRTQHQHGCIHNLREVLLPAATGYLDNFMIVGPLSRSSAGSH